LYVKEILSQHVVAGWGLIPVMGSRLSTSANADYCLNDASLQKKLDARLKEVLNTASHRKNHTQKSARFNRLSLILTDHPTARFQHLKSRYLETLIARIQNSGQ
jgi:hypothetical protein